jgi:hypothetical protein
MGVCQIGECHDHFADCNGERIDGCEADIQQDSDNCGECGHECWGLKECKNGECKL